jgi:glycosyltransferase involved in cell wall biosynthesis
LTTWNVAAAAAAKEYGLPWISIMLDFKDPGERLEAHDRVARTADGHVFLSYWAYEMTRLRPRLHLDGGVELCPDAGTIRGVAAAGKASFVHAGLINRNNGSEFLAAALRQVKIRDAEFMIFGKGRCRKLEEAAAADSRIKLRGYVSAGELAAACEAATAFLSPRPDDIENNSMIFPSKLLEYLKYGKPIICTPNRGMDPRYGEVLNIVSNNDPRLYAEEMDKIMEYSPGDYAALCGKIAAFVNTSRSWRTQAERLTEWIGSVIKQTSRRDGNLTKRSQQT